MRWFLVGNVVALGWGCGCSLVEDMVALWFGMLLLSGCINYRSLVRYGVALWLGMCMLAGGRGGFVAHCELFSGTQ